MDLPPKNQKGQAAAVVIIFSLVLIVAAFSLFKSGKITTNKIQLQNAADAAAYSVSVIEARDLNFASYMNRAMVANEVAIAQFIGLASWASHFRSMGQFMNLYGKLLGAATFGATLPFTEGLAAGWFTAGNISSRFINILANAATVVLHNVNKIYGIGSVAYHAFTVLFAASVINDVIKDNGPPGTQISDFGYLGILAHFASYGALPGLPGSQFSSINMPSQTIDVDDFEDSAYSRLAAIIDDSKDPFTSRRNMTVNIVDFGVTIPIPPPPLKIFIPPIFTVSGSFTVELRIAIEKKGGSELRILLPEKGQVVPGQLANWSGADTVGLQADLAARAEIEVLGFEGIRITFPIIGTIDFEFIAFTGGVGCALRDGRFFCRARLGGSPPNVDMSACNDALAEQQNLRDEALLTRLDDPDIIEDVEDPGPLIDPNTGVERDCTPPDPTGGFEILNVPFNNTAPLSAGFAEASDGVGKANDLNTSQMTNTLPVLGNVDDTMYGSAPISRLAWEQLLPPGTGSIASASLPPTNIALLSSSAGGGLLHKSTVSSAYGGLPYYVDTNKNQGPFLDTLAPNLLLGLVQKKDDFDTYQTTRSRNDVKNKIFQTQDSIKQSGRLEVQDTFADDELAVLSKSEVYFSRPSGNDRFGRHFFRDDAQAEIGSAFNPYWNARLRETSDAERIIALLVQQKEDFVQLESALEEAGDLMKTRFDQIKTFIQGLNPF